MNMPNPQMPPTGVPQAQPQSPVDAITQLLLKTVARTNDLSIEIQSKAVLTLAQAIAQFQQQQPTSIPPEQQFALETQKMQMEHQLKLQELQLKQEAHSQEMALKQDTHQQDQRRQDEQHQQQLSLSSFQARQQAEQQQHQQALNSQKLSSDIAIKEKQAAQRSTPSGE